MYYLLGSIFIISNIILSINIKYINKNQRKLIFIFDIFMASIFMAMRPVSIPDFDSYKNIYEYIQKNTNYGFNFWGRHYQTGVEYGFVYFVQFIKSVIGNKYRLFLFIISILSSFVSILSVKNILVILTCTEKKWNNDYIYENVIACVYFSYFLLNYEGIAIRGACSLALCLLGFSLFLEKKYIKMCVALAVAFLVHRMSILGIGPILVYNFMPSFKSKKNIVRLVVGVMALSIYVYISPNIYKNLLIYMRVIYGRLFEKINYLGYIDEIGFSASFDKKRIFLLLILFFVLYYLGGNRKLSKLLNIYLVGILIMICTMNISGSARIYDYFAIYYLPLIADEYRLHYQDIKFKIGLFLIIAINYFISLRVWEVF